MNDKHTPGPWMRDRESGFDCDVRAVNGRKIASVNVQNQPKSKEGWALRKKENEANACLIAAAPELLKALQRFVKVMDESYDYPDTSGELQRLCEAANEARAAIAKANGGGAA